MSPLELADPVARVQQIIDAARAAGMGIDAAQLALAYLALCTRPLVLLAGPPGSGKSTVARLLARMLGCRPGDGFTDVSVQAHWVNDEPLFGAAGALSTLLAGGSRFHLVLLDELNLTRPEYYLSRLFGALDHHGRIEGKKISPAGMVGTLNIDDFSRPPSPKVLDRAMLLVVQSEAAPRGSVVRCAWQDAPGDGLLPNLPPPVRRAASRPGDPTPEARARIDQWIAVAHQTFGSHPSTRPDLLPSYRATEDVMRFAALHATLGMSSVLPEVAALDHAILGRFLPPLSGPEAEVRPLIEAWLPLSGDLVMSRRRLTRLLEQVKGHGFASFWQ